MKKAQQVVSGAGQQGAAAIALAALLVVVAGILIGSQTALQRVVVSDRIISQLDDGQWAKNAINGFAFVNARLPCPAASPNGAEDCGDLRAKGWLPVETLEAYGDGILKPSRQPVVYMLYRGTDPVSDPDLASEKDDVFQPLVMASTPVASYPLDTADNKKGIKTLSDLCNKLSSTTGGARWAAATKVDNKFNAARAAIVGTDGQTLNVAYALAIARSGSPLSVSSATSPTVNPDMGQLRLESPERAQTESYTDLVQVVWASELFNRLGCSSPMASLDALATANDFTVDAVDAKNAALRMAQDNIELGSMFVGQDLFIIAEAMVNMVEGIFFLIGNTILEAFYALGLPFTLPQVMMHTTGIAEAAKALVESPTPAIKATINMLNDLWQVALNVAVQGAIERHAVWNDMTPGHAEKAGVELPKEPPAVTILKAADASVWGVLNAAP